MHREKRNNVAKAKSSLLTFKSILKEEASGFWSEAEMPDPEDAKEDISATPELESGDESWLDEEESDPVSHRRA